MAAGALPGHLGLLQLLFRQRLQLLEPYGLELADAAGGPCRGAAGLCGPGDSHPLLRGGGVWLPAERGGVLLPGAADGGDVRLFREDARALPVPGAAVYAAGLPHGGGQGPAALLRRPGHRQLCQRGLCAVAVPGVLRQLRPQHPLDPFFLPGAAGGHWLAAVGGLPGVPPGGGAPRRGAPAQAFGGPPPGGQRLPPP